MNVYLHQSYYYTIIIQNLICCSHGYPTTTKAERNFADGGEIPVAATAHWSANDTADPPNSPTVFPPTPTSPAETPTELYSAEAEEPMEENKDKKQVEEEEEDAKPMEDSKPVEEEEKKAAEEDKEPLEEEGKKEDDKGPMEGDSKSLEEEEKKAVEEGKKSLEKEDKKEEGAEPATGSTCPTEEELRRRCSRPKLVPTPGNELEMKVRRDRDKKNVKEKDRKKRRREELKQIKREQEHKKRKEQQATNANGKTTWQLSLREKTCASLRSCWATKVDTRLQYIMHILPGKQNILHLASWS